MTTLKLFSESIADAQFLREFAYFEEHKPQEKALAAITLAIQACYEPDIAKLNFVYIVIDILRNDKEVEGYDCGNDIDEVLKSLRNPHFMQKLFWRDIETLTGDEPWDTNKKLIYFLLNAPEFVTGDWHADSMPLAIKRTKDMETQSDAEQLIFYMNLKAKYFEEFAQQNKKEKTQ